MTDLPLTPSHDGARLRLRVTPGAARKALGEIIIDGEGMPTLKIAVTAPAENGKANDAVIALLAKKMKIAKSHFTIVHGAGYRNKIIDIEGSFNALCDSFLLAVRN